MLTYLFKCSKRSRSMMYYPNAPIKTMQLKFIPFTLKDDVKK